MKLDIPGRMSMRFGKGMNGSCIRKAVSKFLLILLLFAKFDTATGAEFDSAMQDCLIREMQKSEDAITLGEIRKTCEQELAKQAVPLAQKTAVDKRVEEEDKSVRNLWTIMPHRPNYILLANHNFSSMNTAPWEEYAGEPVDLNNTEVKFQISFKFMLWENLFKKRTNGDLFFAYTQLAMWQLYNKDISSPFRDTNYEPEAFLSFDNDWKIFGLRNRFIVMGFSHQSNGREEPLSRSWNRLYGGFVFDKGNFATSLKVWWRIPEDEEDDNNPDIEDYLGNFELRMAYKLTKHSFYMMWRNNLDLDENRGAVELSWSFPLWGTDRIKGYVQYFNGYGQCLLDYNASSSSLGVGFLLTDWL